MAKQQSGTDEHFLHRTMCVVLWNSGDFNKGYFLLVLQIPFKCQNMYVHFCVSVFLLRIGFTLLWPFFYPSLRPVLMVPGYRQVSGRRKDLFCCFGSLFSVGSQGKGWGCSTTHLCLGLVGPLSCVHAPLHCSELLWDSFYTVWYDIWCPLLLEILYLRIFSAYLSLHWTRIVITHAQLLNPNICTHTCTQHKGLKGMKGVFQKKAHSLWLD